MSDVSQILQIASRGSKLSLSLYDFAATIPSATEDAVNLAKGTKDLSRSLWQVGVSQKEDARIASNDARDTVVDIVQQCQMVFTQVEAVVPLDMLRDGMAITYGQKWEWNEVSRAKVRYLLCHLESLRLTLEVMSQAVKSVRVLEWSWHQPKNMVSSEAVTMDRMQLEGLVVEQQLAFFKASQMFDLYQNATGVSGLQLITQDQSSQALTLFEEHAPNPRRLLRYQDTALAESSPTTETQKLALVRRVASHHIDFLLDRWTRLREIRKQQQPSVDSDDSSDEDTTPQPTYSNGTRGPMGPILTHIDEDGDSDEHAVKIPVKPRSPVPIRDTAMRSRASVPPVGSPTARSWNPPAYLGGAPPVRAPGSGTHSTPASPRASFSFAPNLPRPIPSTASLKNPQSPIAQKRIPWRLRVGQKVWDYENETIVNKNCSEHPSQVEMSRNVSTEILASYVSEDAIKDRGYRFDRYMTDTGPGHTTKLESLFSIRRPLTFAQVQDLVKRTEERYELRYKKARPRPHLDHAATAPLPTPGQYLQTPTDNHRSASRGLDDRGPKSTRSSASSANTSDSDYERERERQRSRSRRGSTTSSRASKGSQKGSKTASNLSKVAAGAGIAALLEGVVEGLGHL